jgi:two-component system, OmpR family, response regulator VanR
MKKKILIVEDDNDSREIMNLFITRDGYEAIKGKSSNEVDCIRRGREARLIFMDMELPDLDGVKTAILRTKSQNLSYSCRCAYGMDIGTMAGESFERGYCNILDKADLASNVKGDHGGTYKGIVLSG